MSNQEAENSVGYRKPLFHGISVTSFKIQMFFTTTFLVPLMFFMFSIVGMLPIMLFMGGNVENMSFGTALTFTIFAELSTVASYIFITNKWMLDDIKHRLGFINFKWSHFLLSSLLGVLMFGALQLFASVFDYFFGDDSALTSDTSSEILSTTGFSAIIVMGLLTPILVPIVEEILFRGVILNGLLLAKIHAVVAILISAFIFAIAHFQGWETSGDKFTIVWIMLLATVKGIVFYKTRSVYNTMGMHMAYNGSTVIVSMLLL